MCGYHRFQQADFSQSVLAELGKLFEARSELLHQKVALHAYTALLSRLQVESYLYHLLKGERHVFSSSPQNYQNIPVNDCFCVTLKLVNKHLFDVAVQLLVTCIHTVRHFQIEK